MKFSETDEQLRTERLNYIRTRWDQLNLLSKDALERIIKYLVLVNAGGAVAMLSFLGTSAQARGLLLPKLALACFGLGIVLVGVLNLLILLHIERIFVNWRQTTPQFYEDKVEWEDLTANDDKLAYTVWPEYLAGYAAFFCFIAGAAIGVCALFSVKP